MSHYKKGDFTRPPPSPRRSVLGRRHYSRRSETDQSLSRQILVAQSRFFAVKLSDRWSKQQRTSNPYIVEIADCDDVEVYIEALSLMYCKDLRKKLMKEDVTRVLGILKTRLGNPEVWKVVDQSVQEYLTEYLELHPDVALAAKKARELVRQKSVLRSSSLPRKLADCSATNPEDSD
ncbi:unnamed protein product [Camellia sinensis]